MVLADKQLKLAFGNAVRARRTAAGLSQEALAEQADIHRTYMSDVERGTRNIALVNMFRIAEGLGIPLSLLICDVEELRRTSHEETRK
jgi:transcriptional regulator with XRE-family HTH domain